MKKIAIAGFGTVGGGIAHLLHDNQAVLAANAGENISLGAILVRTMKAGSEFAHLMTTDFSTIEQDEDICLVAEAIGGVDVPFEIACRTLKAGKGFVTANKALVAEKGHILHALAKEHNVPFLFEAAVGGGMPIIRPIRTSLSSTGINYVYGILNATSNFILSEMDKGSTYDEAVKEAQARGYAEADPSADVDGIDSARKLAIILAMITGKQTSPDDIRTVGITALKDTCGGKVKLLARAAVKADGVHAEVSPVLVGDDNLMTCVKSDRNGIVIRGEGSVETAFFGVGAGAIPTASAVLSDVVEAIRRPVYSDECAWGADKLNVLPWTDSELAEYRS